MDCLDGMRLMKEQGLKADWCITDPPYGIGVGSTAYANGVSMVGNALAKRRDYSQTENGWDSIRIEKRYFNLMRELSKEQIIFGGNYYADILPPTKSWVVWDKRVTDNMRNNFADCELGWCSKDVARVFRYMYNGMLQGNMKNKDQRFHPTQKPTQLWIMLLNYYTKKGDLILDPFAGSQSLRVACHKMQRHYIGFELDKEYFDNGSAWFNSVSAQLSLFDL